MEELISEYRTPRAWLLISNDNPQHAGNDGYPDDIYRSYYYDIFVQNSLRLVVEDLVVLRNKERLLGIGKIEKIQDYFEPKKLSRCPACTTTKFQKREKKKPIFRCIRCHHVFDIPIIDYKPCKKFIAYFGNTFIKLDENDMEKIKIEELIKACPKYNGQMSMQLIDFQKFKAILLQNVPEIATLVHDLVNENNNFKYIKADDADENEHITEYVNSEEDKRETVFRQIKERRGQSKFRDALRQRYGDQCMISGLKLLDVLEAAHISPYRDIDDNHPANGLLLRADLHTLFDLNLLGINPESLEVKFHPKVLETGYQKLEGRKLRCSKHKPSQSALVSRWKQFLNRLHENY